MNTPKLTQSIIELLELQNMPKDKQDALLAQMSEIVQSRISRKIDSQLSPNDKKAFDQMLATNPNEATVNVFLAKVVPNVQLLVNEEIMKFKQEMAAEVASMKTLMT